MTRHKLAPSPLTQSEICADLIRRNPRGCALFLDIDGTLLDLAATPQDISPPPGLAALVARVGEVLGGAVAIVSGRRIDDIDRILSPLRPVAAGVHGTEFRLAPNAPVTRPAAGLKPEIVATLEGLGEAFPGVLVEPKGPGLAIHYRLAPQWEQEIAQKLATVLSAHSGALEIWPGQKVFEVIPSGIHKGTGLAMLAALPAFANRIPIMIGDDVGDEPAFEAAEHLKGYGLRVAGENFRKQHADFTSPTAVRAWLEDLVRD